MRVPAILTALYLLAACDAGPEGAAGGAADETLVVTELLGGAADERYERALAVRELEFPADHGAHPGFRSEWWYYTGNLLTQTGRHFGFQITFFRFALPPDDTVRDSAWAARQLWMAHFAVTDTQTGRHLAVERFARGALGLAGAEAEPFRVWTDHWQAAATGEGFFPQTLRASSAEFALELVLDTEKPPVLQGDAGLDAKGPEPGNASYYYSYTRLTASGTVRAGADTHRVAGTAWLDREWSTSALGPELEGWDWFALQLADGRDVMFYRLRRRDGTMSPESTGVIVAPDGRVTRRLGPGDVTLEPLAHWTSPQSGARYPVRWRLGIPAAELTLAVDARLDAQELDLSVRYWEGAVTVSGTSRGAPVDGVGYVELAGVPGR